MLLGHIALAFILALTHVCAGVAAGLVQDDGVASRMMRRETEDQPPEGQNLSMAMVPYANAMQSQVDVGSTRVSSQQAGHREQRASAEPAQTSSVPKNALLSTPTSAKKASAAVANLNSEGIVTLWKAADDAASPGLVAMEGELDGLEVEQLGSLRRLRFHYPAANGQMQEGISSMECGRLDSDRPFTCESQKCAVAKDSNSLVENVEGQELVAAGPAMLGARLKRLALIGVAGGMVVQFLHRVDAGSLSVDAVESSPQVATALLSCFGVPVGDHVRLHLEDGVQFLQQQANESFDWIIVNAPGAQAKFATPEMHKHFKRLVGPEGIVTFSLAGLDLKAPASQMALAVAHEYWEHAFTTTGGHAITLSDKDKDARREETEKLKLGQLPRTATFTQLPGGLQPIAWSA